MADSAGHPDVRISFDPDYQDMIAEIYVDDACLGLISQEQGRLEIELIPGRNEPQKLELLELEAAIAYAKRRLLELRPRQDEPDMESLVA